MKAFVVAGTHSGAGKTTVSLGLMAAFKGKGMAVQAFKVGPDYIDQGLHGMILERPCRNLDPWMMGEEGVKRSFSRHAISSHVAVIEGVMGLFDGEYGTWKVASILGLPVVLVVDAYGVAETIGPIVEGLKQECERRNIHLIGVVLTKVGSSKHLKRLRKALTVPLVGFLPKDKAIEIPSRHLGLYVAEEEPLRQEALERLKAHVLENFDLNLILGLSEIHPFRVESDYLKEKGELKKRIAIPRDRAFCFYYHDNLDTFEHLGYEVCHFSPLMDPCPPECDAMYIGGGYPELYAKELSENYKMIKAIRELSLAGVPIYGECGGLIYLSKGLQKEQEVFEMVGVFPFLIQMKKTVTLGYREINSLEDFWLCKKGTKFRGHEFHYSDIVNSETVHEVKRIFETYDQHNTFLGLEGYRVRNTVATYVHSYFAGIVG